MDSPKNAEQHDAATCIYSVSHAAGRANAQAASPNICVEIQHPSGTVKVNWPTENAAACATFLRDLLR